MARPRTTAPMLLMALLWCLCPPLAAQQGDRAEVPWHAQGEKAGDPTRDSVILLTRLTAVEKGEIECDVPGMDGRARFEVSETPDFRDIIATPWANATAENDHTVKQTVKGLSPDTHYYCRVRISNPAQGAERTGPTRRFKTAAAPDRPRDVSFVVVTGQGYSRRESDRGHHAYLAMEKLDPDFIILTGDTIYYTPANNYYPKKITWPVKDGDRPRGADPVMWQVIHRRPHWHAMYALPIQRKFFGKFAGYWQVDDHDYKTNDVAQPYKPGEIVFLEQNPVPDPTYRTVRRGKALQIWFVEGRMYRQLRGDPPTIWGKEQFDWLVKSIGESDAVFKVLSSPTPVVGHGKKLQHPYSNDNHAVEPFIHERMAFFDKLKEMDVKNFFVVCGDKHWKYHTRDTNYGFHEFCCGALSGKHHGGGRWLVQRDESGFIEYMHLRDKESLKHLALTSDKERPGPGGFLRVVVQAEGEHAGDPRITFEHYDTPGEKLYSYWFAAGGGQGRGQ